LSATLDQTIGKIGAADAKLPERLTDELGFLY
jgi:hypothetical protein